MSKSMYSYVSGDSPVRYSSIENCFACTEEAVI